MYSRHRIGYAVLSAVAVALVGGHALAEGGSGGEAPSVLGTKWAGADSDGDDYVVQFEADGVLAYTSPTGSFRNGLWKQSGSALYWQINDHYSEYLGEVKGRSIEGIAWNQEDHRWTWKFDLQSGSKRPKNVAAGKQTLAGEWKEYWGTPGETDVNYNDRYRISIAADGTVTVAILEKDQRIENARIEGNRLTFQQFTSFKLDYDLRLQPDGKWLVGTVTTPEKVVNVKWERIK